MSVQKTLEVVFLWHMHQPDYRDPETGTYALPWVYLHALKDYTDMAAHLERHPRIRAVVNFVPVLLEQLEDYCRQFATGAFRDPLLRLLGHEDFGALAPQERALVLERCFRANPATMIEPFPHYRRLHDLYGCVEGEGPIALGYLSGAMLADLVTWYHLAWTGETERRNRPLLAELFGKGDGYSLRDRLRLRELIGEVLRAIVPRYRALAERGQIELSSTPSSHPLAPLLIDFGCAREPDVEAVLPAAAGYPGGRERVRSQLAHAIAYHKDRFGSAPAGIWPAEGAVSTAFVELLAEAGCRWAASSSAVLGNSLNHRDPGMARVSGNLYFGYRLEGAAGPALFFRDEYLSDLIGFEYAKWHGRDAASHFVDRLDEIRAQIPEGETRLVSVILDGENAWEQYAYNAYYFFEDLYAELEARAGIRTATFAGYLAEHEGDLRPLPRLVAGTWVYGNFSTWIGSADKNRAWDLLCAAKAACDRALASQTLSAAERARAQQILSVCESSDWFWWFGDYNPALAVASFDAPFRANLRALYRVLDIAAPEALAEPISRGGGSPEIGGAMRRAH